jgi:DNA-binding NarL/FixJ family response regulator
MMYHPPEPFKAGSKAKGNDCQSFLLVEDHPIFVDGFSSAIKSIFPTASLSVVTCGELARKELRQASFDLVFLDLNLPDMNGLDLLQEMQLAHIVQPIVILTGSIAPPTIEKARQGGAVGAFSKRINHTVLGHYCHQLLMGKTVFEAEPMQQSYADGLAYGPTGREIDVLAQLAEGLDNARICQLLNISDSTLRTHLRSLFMKLQVTNRTACVVKATRFGWI